MRRSMLESCSRNRRHVRAGGEVRQVPDALGDALDHAAQPRLGAVELRHGVEVGVGVHDLLDATTDDALRAEHELEPFRGS